MVICKLCNQKFEMLTESHMNFKHKINCERYRIKFDIRKGKMNPEHSKKMKGSGNPIFGIPRSTSTRKKISMIHKSRGTFKGRLNPMFGKTHSPRTRMLLSKKLREYFKDNVNPFFEKKHSLRTKKKISRIRKLRGLAVGENNPMFGKHHTKETRTKIGEYNKQFYRNHPEKHPNFVIFNNQTRGGYISKFQRKIFRIIKLKYPEAKLNFPIVTDKTVYFADIGVPSIKLDLECDGSYWHRNRSKIDKKRDGEIEKFGWTVFRIVEDILPLITTRKSFLNSLNKALKLKMRNG